MYSKKDNFKNKLTKKLGLRSDDECERVQLQLRCLNKVAITDQPQGK